MKMMTPCHICKHMAMRLQRSRHVFQSFSEEVFHVFLHFFTKLIGEACSKSLIDCMKFLEKQILVTTVMSKFRGTLITESVATFYNPR